MTTTTNERLIWLDDILGEEGYAAIEHRDGTCCIRATNTVSHGLQAGHLSDYVSSNAVR